MYSKAFWLLAAVLLMAGPGETRATVPGRRIFDFTPVSNTNPIVASIGDSIHIPLSEYDAYRAAEKENTLATNAALAEKKAVLQDLIGEYLLVDDGYKNGIDKRPEFIRKMDYTRTILLSEFLVAREVDARAKTADEYNHLLASLQNRVFDAAEIEVSNEAYEKLKRAAKSIDAAGQASVQPDPQMARHNEDASARIRAVMENTDDSVLARYNGKAVMVKEVLAIYISLHSPRPPFEKNEDLIAILRPLVMPDLLAAAAKKQNIEALPEFQNKLEQNRNALLRMYEHGVLQEQASEGMKAPDIDQRLKSWYKKNAERYAVKGPTGANTIPPYAEVRERVEGDYSVDLWERLQAEKIRSLRKSYRIETNDQVLQQPVQFRPGTGNEMSFK